MTVVLITGAGQGLGRDVAGQLAAQATVVITARDPEKAKQTATELDVHALGVGLDVSDDASVHEAAAAFEREFARLDVLINNAAAYVNWSELPTEADLAAAHAALETNLFGARRDAVRVGRRRT